MGKTRTSGITTDAGNKVVGKWVDGERIYARLGAVSQEDAEKWLAERIQRIKLAKERGSRPRIIFREASVRYLEDNRELASIDAVAFHLALLDPWIGDLGIDEYTMRRCGRSKKTGCCQPSAETARRRRSR